MFKLSFEGTKAEWDALFAGMLAHVRTPKPVEVVETPKLDAVQSRIAPELRRKQDADTPSLARAKEAALQYKEKFVTFNATTAGTLDSVGRAEFNKWCRANNILVANIGTAARNIWVYTPYKTDAQGNTVYANGPRGKDSALRGAPARVEHKPYHDKLDEVEIEILPRFNELQGVG